MLNQLQTQNTQVTPLKEALIVTHDDLPTIMADSIKLMQLFKNLIGNAIKFGTRNPPKIHIGTTRLENEWLFCVYDNGIGLAIVKKSVEAHGGQISVSSQEGVGTNFCVNLPLVYEVDRERKISGELR